MRHLFNKKGIITSKLIKGKDSEGQKCKDYFNWSEEIVKVPSHRLLAMRRGEKELILSIEISPDEHEATVILERHFVRSGNQSGEQVRMACLDCYKRLLKPSMETAIRFYPQKKKQIWRPSKYLQKTLSPCFWLPIGSKKCHGHCYW